VSQRREEFVFFPVGFHESRLCQHQVGFGSFATATRKASTGRNPRTGEEIQIEESTSVRFKPGKALKDALN